MKNSFLAPIFSFLMLYPIAHGQNDCQWSENYESLECGVRQSGDQLLFNDILSSNWTFGIANRLDVDYININITWWRVELSDWMYFSRSVSSSYFSISAGVSNSSVELFIMNVTAYGYPTYNIEVPFGCILEQDGKHGNNKITYNNPKHQLIVK